MIDVDGKLRISGCSLVQLLNEALRQRSPFEQHAPRRAVQGAYHIHIDDGVNPCLLGSRETGDVTLAAKEPSLFPTKEYEAQVMPRPDGAGTARHLQHTGAATGIVVGSGGARRRPTPAG